MGAADKCCVVSFLHRLLIDSGGGKSAIGPASVPVSSHVMGKLAGAAMPEKWRLRFK
jgi:hypothetical protein